MISFSSLSKRRGATLAGVFSLAFGCVLLLCGAGSAPIENLLPQGAMQGDLNAGGHSFTNAATVSATNVVVSGSLTAPASFTLPFTQLTGTPTTLSGYGITDPIVLTSGSYANPSWITGLAASKLTGALPAISGASLTGLASSQVSGLGALATASMSGATTGQVPTFNGSAFVPETPSGGGGFSPPVEIGSDNTTIFTNAEGEAIYVDNANGNSALQGYSSGGTVPGDLLGFDPATGGITLNGNDANTPGGPVTQDAYGNINLADNAQINWPTAFCNISADEGVITFTGDGGGGGFNFIGNMNVGNIYLGTLYDSNNSFGSTGQMLLAGSLFGYPVYANGQPMTDEDSDLYDQFGNIIEGIDFNLIALEAASLGGSIIPYGDGIQFPTNIYTAASNSIDDNAASISNLIPGYNIQTEDPNLDALSSYNMGPLDSSVPPSMAIAINAPGGLAAYATLANVLLTAQSGSVSSVASGSPTTGTPISCRVGATVNVTSLTTDSIQVQVTYTDENSVAQTVNVGAAAATSGVTPLSPIDIETDGSSPITVITTDTGLGTSVYDVGATIQQLN